MMNGVYAAVATPMGADGRLSRATFDRLVEFLIGSGVNGICVGGATSEYPNVDVADRKIAIAAAAERLPADRALLVGIGAASVRQVIELGEAARASNAAASLLSMPMFFRYDQHDLQAFCSEVARTLRMPVLLYDLPDFTNGIAPSTAVELMRGEEFISGIKDSSGIAGNLVRYASARDGHPWTLLVGHDRLLYEGLNAGWNGTVSGIAGFCPELPLAIYRSFLSGDLARAARLQGLLDEAVTEIGTLPTPWGIRLGLAARGFDMGSLPLPLSAARREQLERFQTWVGGWLGRAVTNPEP